MLALIRKNLWQWRRSRIAACVIFGGALVFSYVDSFVHWPAENWIYVLPFLILLAQSTGASVLGADLRHDNVRFLEYLPIRWWHLWLANWLDGVLVCLLAVGLLSWHRVWHW